MLRTTFFLFLLIMIGACGAPKTDSVSDVLPSWNEPYRTQLISELDKLKGDDIIVSYDMDGTLISEKPLYFLLDLMMDYVSIEGMSKEEIFNALNTFNERPDYKTLVDSFLQVREVPVFKPMLELMDLCDARGYKVIICTGSEAYFAEKVAEKVFPAAQDVIGTDLSVRINDEEGKVLNLQDKGYKPDMSFGNSTGDYAMIEFSKNGGWLVIHDDEARGEVDRPDEYVAECKELVIRTISIKNAWKVVK